MLILSPEQKDICFQASPSIHSSPQDHFYTESSLHEIGFMWMPICPQLTRCSHVAEWNEGSWDCSRKKADHWEVKRWKAENRQGRVLPHPAGTLAVVWLLTSSRCLILCYNMHNQTVVLVLDFLITSGHNWTLTHHCSSFLLIGRFGTELTP